MGNSQIDQWANCYGKSWKGLIVPEAFAHPAKMAYGLLVRILDHAAEQGWLAPGGIILDPFGGIGSIGIVGAYKSYQVVCCELEERFTLLAKQNFALHAAKWRILGCPQPVILQGDSRRLCELVAGLARRWSGGAEVIMSSPPYSEMSILSHDQAAHSSFKVGNPTNQIRGTIKRDARHQRDYGTSPGQLGAMPPGKLADCLVSSPPYSTDERLQRKLTEKSIGGREPETNVIYGQTPGQLGNVKPGHVAAIVSSAPYEGTPVVASGVQRNEKSWQAGKDLSGGKSKHYGESQGQLGETQGETFWSAAMTIVEQCYQILRPGGYAIWVVKDFVRAKKRVDFTGDWRRLCEAIGFKTLHEHHALLFKEDRFIAFWGEEIIARTDRNSFFRTLANNKAGWRAYWEVVPEDEREEWLAIATAQLSGKPRHTILVKAQELAFKDTAERIYDWNEDIRIDYELVLCQQKEGRLI